MLVQLNWILISIYFIKVVSSTPNVTNWIGHFKVLLKHPKIKQCAAQLTPKGHYKSLRVSDTECQGFWVSLIDDMKQLSYGYAELFSEMKGFKPSYTLTEANTLLYHFPAVFKAGSRVNVFFQWPDSTADYLSFFFTEDGGTEKGFVIFRVNLRTRQLEIIEDIWEGTVPITVYNNKPMPRTDCKISFVLDDKNTIEVFFNGKALIAWKGLISDFYRITTVDINAYTFTGNQLVLMQRFEFVQG